ncbi:hypothetical protein HHI36_001717 [Cryptolaemus montrouzieri]|uniref:Uncharacterized protein n=1 Tax=Cryptolaemus montrouzieri TaxID=559131 RepID=A0ABD2P972_9CUCU
MKAVERNSKNLMTFKKFATEDFIENPARYYNGTLNPYFTGNLPSQQVKDQEYAVFWNGNDMKVNENNHMRRFNTEPLYDTRKFHIKRMKERLDTLFVKQQTEFEGNKLRLAKEQSNENDFFTRDSLESNCEIREISETKELWKKFLERKKNSEKSKQKLKKVPLFKGNTSEFP